MKCYKTQSWILFLRIFQDKGLPDLKTKNRCDSLKLGSFYPSFNFFFSSETWLLESLLWYLWTTSSEGVGQYGLHYQNYFWLSVSTHIFLFFGLILIYLISSQLGKLSEWSEILLNRAEQKQTIAGNKMELRTYLLSYICSFI